MSKLKDLALDIHKGRVFTSVHLPDANHITMVFFPLVLAGAPFIEQLRRNPPGLYYEYMKNALPRSVNGCPTFTSVHMLGQAETRLLWRYMRQLEEMEAAFKER